MSAAAGRALYTPGLLALAVELARYPLDPSLPYRGEARSRSCGSTIDLALALDRGALSAIGLRAQACAVGQAAAAIFAREAVGRSARQLETAEAAIAAWLAGTGGRPDWPDLAMLEPARDYSARHGAIMLPWRAALAALNKVDAAS